MVLAATLAAAYNADEQMPAIHMVAGVRLLLLSDSGIALFTIAEVAKNGTSEEDLKEFIKDSIADERDKLFEEGRPLTAINAYQAAGAKYFDAWKRRQKKRIAFEELAVNIKASAEQVEKWKKIPDSSSGAKRMAEEMVFSCVEELSRTAKRLKSEI